MYRPRFEGCRALVTGGASGIGLATARLLATEGAELLLLDRDRGAIDTLRDEFADHEVVVCDQTNENDLGLLAKTVAERPLHVCLANAGYGAYGAFLDADIASLRKHLEVNVVGTAAIMQIAARSMVAANHGGSIVVTASTASMFPTTLFSHYAASKAAVMMLVRSVAGELGPHGVRVNGILPGVTTTQMTDSILSNEEAHGWAAREAPLGRVASPDDIASAAAFLASNDAGYVTGTGLLVDGGLTINGFPRWFARDSTDPDAQWQAYPDYVSTALRHP